MVIMRSAVLGQLQTLFDVGVVAGLTDGQLLERFLARREGEAEPAFAALVARHGAMVLSVCRGLLGNPHDAEDAFQVTFLVLARNAGSLRCPDRLGPWLYGVAHRTARQVKVRERRRRRREMKVAMSGSRPAVDVGGHDFKLETREEIEALHEEIQRLPARYREAIVLCDLQGETHEEAARRLGRPVGTISARLSRARERLRGRLSRRGLALPAGVLAGSMTSSHASLMPAALVDSTIKVAMTISVGLTAGAVPASIAALSEGVSKSMFLTKLKTISAIVLLAGAAAGGVAVVARQSSPVRTDAADSKALHLPQVARNDRPPTAERATIQFPADRSMGVLYTRRRGAQDGPGGEWEHLGEAIGEVQIPPGREVRLDLGAAASEDLSRLRRLRPDDLRTIHVMYADLRGDALANIERLTGLEEMDLVNCTVGDDGTRHLAKLPRLKILRLGGAQVGDAGIARLASIRSLERLDLSDCWVTEVGLAHVGRMKSLKSLSLYRSDIGDEGLAQLSGLTDLESLRLAGCQHISDAGLAHLAGLTSLKRLDLEFTPITDAGLVQLTGLKNLEDLNLVHTQVGDAGLAHLRGLRTLSKLSLPEGISDVGLSHVAVLRSLHVLIIYPSPVTDRGIAALSGLDQLQELNLVSVLDASRITDAAAAHLAGLPALKTLWLQFTEIGDDGLKALSQARSLESLYLNGNRVTSKGLRHLSRFPALTRLSLYGIRGPGGSLHDLQPLRGLTDLSVKGSGWLGVDGVGDRAGDEGLGYLSGMTQLKSLKLDLPLTDEGVKHLASLTVLRRLEIDNRDNRVTDDGLVNLSRMKELGQLFVSGWITDRGLTHLDGLRSLYLARLRSRPGAISDEAVAALKSRNPSLQLVDYPRGKALAPSPPAVGQAAPDVEVEAFDGKKIRLSELKGKVVLLYFWATWCSSCLADTPKLKAFIEGCRGGVGLFEAISLSLDEDAHWAKRHALRNGLGWPQAWVGTNSPACSAYAVNSAPHYVVISPDGKVAYEGREFDAAKKAVNGALERSLPNDPMLAEQWYLYPPGNERGSPGSINAIEAWRHIRTAKPVVVALIDGGMNYRHPDLEANIWKNERETQNGKDDDGNGYVDDLYGWDFAYANNHPISRREPKFPDQFDHGTALASLIAAVADNGIGTVGVCRNVKIMNLRIGGAPEFEGEKRVNLKTPIPEAIRYATRNGAKVIACAIYGIRDAEGAVEAALKEAEKAGVLFVRAAGNQHRSIDEDEDYKWLAQFSNVLVVGGTTREGILSPHMNFGKRVGIAAPSVDMVFPSFDGYVRSKGPGTSFSTAIVAGVAATLLSQAPDLTPPQVIARLRDASVLAPGMEGVIGGGRLDMAKLFPP